MPRIIVEAEGPAREIVFWERVGVEDFGTEHFRRALCDRIAWAVEDAEDAGGGVVIRDERFTHGAETERERDRVPDPEPVFA